MRMTSVCLSEGGLSSHLQKDAIAQNDNRIPGLEEVYELILHLPVHKFISRTWSAYLCKVQVIQRSAMAENGQKALCQSFTASCTCDGFYLEATIS